MSVSIFETDIVIEIQKLRIKKGCQLYDSLLVFYNRITPSIFATSL